MTRFIRRTSYLINYEKGFDIKPLKKKGKEECTVMDQQTGYGRFIDRVEQPLFVPGQKGNDKSGTRKATICRHVRCVETGEVFEKVSDIGKLCPSYDLDKLVPCILNAMRTGNRSLGHKWVRVTDEQYVEYIEQNQKLLETLRDNPAAKEHGSLAAARLPKEAQCGCAKCAMAREQFEKVRALSLKMVRKSNRGA